MTQERTDRSKYKSPSTGEYCTAAQYAAEIMCQRMAENKNEGSLCYKFWNTAKWKKVYIRQVTEANKLVKQYGDEAVVKAILSPSGSKIYSLGFPDIGKLIGKFKQELDKASKKAANSKDYDIPENPSQMQPLKSKKEGILDKLRKLDG